MAAALVHVTFALDSELEREARELDAQSRECRLELSRRRPARLELKLRRSTGLEQEDTPCTQRRPDTVVDSFPQRRRQMTPDRYDGIPGFVAEGMAG